MNKFKTSLFISILFLNFHTVPNTWAQTPSDETVQKFITLTETEKLLDINQAIALQQTSENLWQDVLPKPTTQNTQIRNQYIDVISEFEDNVKKHIYAPQVRERELALIKRALKQNYTEAELNAQIEFYQTPIGRQILSKQAHYYEQVSRDANELNQRIYKQAMQAELPNTLNKMKNLQNQHSPKSTPKNPKKTQ